MAAMTWGTCLKRGALASAEYFNRFHYSRNMPKRSSRPEYTVACIRDKSLIRDVHYYIVVMSMTLSHRRRPPLIRFWFRWDGRQSHVLPSRTALRGSNNVVIVSTGKKKSKTKKKDRRGRAAGHGDYIVRFRKIRIDNVYSNEHFGASKYAQKRNNCVFINTSI